MKKLTYLIIFAFLTINFSFVLLSHGNGIGKPTFVYLTTDLKNTQTEISFGCEKKIFVVAYFKEGLKNQDYNLKAIWRNPNGEIFHRTSRDYPKEENTANASKNALWLWLKIDKSIYDTMMDPSSILGSNPLSGSWSVELYINDIMVSEIEFLLNC